MNNPIAHFITVITDLGWDYQWAQTRNSGDSAFLQVLDITRLTGPIHTDGFCKLPSLKELTISDSNLSVLPDLNCLKRTVSKLRLLNSGIRQFPPCYFNNWRRLQYLTLTGNDLTEIPAIESLSSTLFYLGLVKNNINTIYGSWATVSYEKLSHIHLDHNKLTRFDFTDLPPLPKNMISLIGNQIAHLYQPLTYLHTTYKIVLTGNPLVCDAKLAWVAASDLVISKGFCSSPQCLHGVNVSRLSKYIHSKQVVTHLPPRQNGSHFGRRHFQMNFLEWKWSNSKSNFTEMCCQESNWQ